MDKVTVEGNNFPRKGQIVRLDSRTRISQKTDTKGSVRTAQRDKSVRQEAKGRKFLTCSFVCVCVWKRRRRLIHSWRYAFGIRAWEASRRGGTARSGMQTRGTGPTMVSPLVKGTPDYRSGVLPSAANLQESANRSPLPGEPPDGSLKSKRSNGPVPKVASQPRTTSLVHRFRDGGKRLARKLLLSHQRCGIRGGPFFLLSPGRGIVEFQDKLDGIFF